MSEQTLNPAGYHILLALADGEAHGYALMSAIEELSGGTVRMGPGTLYGTIKRLLANGLIEESDERPDEALDDRRRRYYRITAAGRTAVSAESVRLARLVHAAERRGLLPRGLRPQLGGAS